MRILARFPDFDQEPQTVAVQPLPEETAVVEPAATATASGGHATWVRMSLASRLSSVLVPRRRGLRQINAGWGSIGFLAMVAAGIWSLAWWQDHRAAVKPGEEATPQMAAVPLESPTPLVR